MGSVDQDPLLLLRRSIANESKVVPTADASSAEEVPLAQATHLHFTHPAPVSIPIDTPTRFESNGQPVDLRSIYFAWLNHDVAIPIYNAAATKLDDDLAGAATVHKFAFVERLDLITWLEGASEDSEYIKPLAADKDGAAASAAAAVTSAAPVSSRKAGRGTLDPRLAQIYNGERRMGNRNSVLRGIKPTDFSHVRKLAQPFMSKKPNGPPTNIANNPALALNQKPQRRPDPIIILSPSASSLLRMSNVQAFLEGGKYAPPDPSSEKASASVLQIQRLLKDIDPSRPMRFIVVEGVEQFKPEYWNRVVAVFTTGQAWQFKHYRWSDPNDLFRHVPGVYMGWRGDQPPPSIRAYGKGVTSYNIEKWRPSTMPGVDAGRWRDREVVESIWKAIEGSMRARGWRKDAAPASI